MRPPAKGGPPSPNAVRPPRDGGLLTLGARQLELPPKLVELASHNANDRAWLRCLPERVEALCRRWSLTLEGGPSLTATCSFVAFARRERGSPAVLKLGLPHFESAQEAEGLRFYAGGPAVQLLDAEPSWRAMLLERCEPGIPLGTRSIDEQDDVIAASLRRLWRVPEPPHPFLPLSVMVSYWVRGARARRGQWVDAGLVRAGLERLVELAAPAPGDVLLATDLHAHNVLSARRVPWLVIDPKPFVGDRAYDATQHLLNCTARLRADPVGSVDRFSQRLEVSPARVQSWLFARLAVHARAERTVFGLSGNDAVQLARQLDKGTG